MTSDETPDETPEEPARPEPEGGDPACWVDQVCPVCGRLGERLPSGQCAACGAPWDVG